MILSKEELLKNARLKASENINFQETVRLMNSSELDALAVPFIAKAYQDTDCLSCGNCCKELRPPLTPSDIKRLSFDLNIDEGRFKETYIEDTGHTDYQIMGCNPCSFLNGNACTVYEQRPDSCADYPHLHHPGLKYRIRSVLENYSVCPIVVRVVDELKILVTSC
ncbi:MAG: YkgJ family cysteine cluster protein [Cytophagales bacterium]|nr:YkgJ family cysteine cluster protein [Cytophaga sp.]